MSNTNDPFVEHPFAAAGRRALDGTVLPPDLVIVTPDGIVRRFNPTTAEDEAADTHELPELRGARILRVTASAQDPRAGEERLVVTISAVRTDGNAAFILLQRTAAGWNRVELRRGPGDPRDVAMASSTGFAAIAGGKVQTYYATMRRAGLSVYAYGFDNSGKDFIVFLADNPRGVDVVATPADTREFSIARIEGDRLSFYPPAREIDWRDMYRGVVPVYINFARPSTTFQLPAAPQQPDGGCMTPITDSMRFCRGMLIRTVNGELYVCAFADGRRRQSVGVLTGHPNGPRTVKQVRSAVYRERHFHLFAVDEQDRIWYADWPSGAPIEDLAWDSTGQSGSYIDAPQIMNDKPFVFVQHDVHRVDRIAEGNPGEPWTRTRIDVSTLQAR
ncbi:MAG TPA: hypothetical protein VEK57_22870 [Thermoanaerobaculia bacterium]|nr:hypothetical protein [Thermoanaerobaculia bacterium]